MPNWCNNNITIQGPTETIRQLWEDATAEGSGLLNAMVPMPEELKDTVKGSNGDAVNWYDWAVSNWGTKWDVDTEGLEFTDNGDGTASIDGWFDSAWAPPIGAYEKFLDDMDNCSLTASYYECGMDFGGFYDNGDDEYLENLREEYEAGDDASDLYKQLDDEYGLSEQYDEWDQLNDDDEEEVDLTDLSPNTV